MKYFDLKLEIEEAESRYRELCNIYHPDKGGKHSDFIEMKTEYEEYKIIWKYLPEILRLFAPKPQIHQSPFIPQPQPCQKTVIKEIDVNKSLENIASIFKDGLNFAKEVTTLYKETKKPRKAPKTNQNPV